VRALQTWGMTELISMVQVESQHSVGVPTRHDLPRFVFISKKLQPEVGSH